MLAIRTESEIQDCGHLDLGRTHVGRQNQMNHVVRVTSDADIDSKTKPITLGKANVINPNLPFAWGLRYP